MLPMLIIGLMLATLLVLVLGIITLARGSEKARRLSNRLMVWRVSLQAGAVALIGVLFFLK